MRMPKQAQVRAATIGDLELITGILSKSGLATQPDAADRVRMCLERSPDTCFVSESAGIVNGVLLSVFNGFHLFLSHLAVLEGEQHTGLGKTLHDHLLARGRELRAIGVITDSWLTSTGFYYRLGYRLPGAVFLIKDVKGEP